MGMMALLIAPIFSMLFIFSPAYGQEISVQTDKSSYTLKEYVVATGQVANYNPAEGKTVRIDVFDSEGEAFTGGETEFQDPCCLFSISDRKVTPNEDGFYSYRFVIAGNETASKVGQTTIRASFDGKSVETAFEVTSTHVSSTSGQGVLSVQTDKVSYTLKEYVEVSGQISNYNPSDKKTVRIDVFDPEDKVFSGGEAEHFDPCCLRVISGEEVEPSNDGSYSFRFYIPTNLTSQVGQFYIPTNLTSSFGQYTAQASYDGKSVETAFEVTSTHVSSTSGQGVLSVQTDKSLYLLPDIVRDILANVKDIPSGYVNVSGQVANYNPAEGKTVRIDVFDPEDKVFSGGEAEHFDPCCLRVISGEEVEPSNDGSYSYRFFIPIRSLMPDRVNEFKQGLYTAQATYDGKSVETTFRISETPGAPDLGGAIESPLMYTSNFPPPLMVPGRTANQVLELRNYGTAEGHFLVLVGFSESIQYDLAGIIYPFGESEVIYSNDDVIVISSSLKPQEIKIVSIPIRIPPEVVQFERETPLQEGKLLIVDDRFPTAVTVDIATMSLEDWVLLKQEFSGAELVNQAITKSIERDERFLDQIDALKAERCQDADMTATVECANLVMGNTREVAPELADYVEFIVLEPPENIDITTDFGDSAESAVNGEIIPTSLEESLRVLLPLAHAQSPSNQSSVEKPHICPKCNDGPSISSVSDNGTKFIAGKEGYAGEHAKCKANVTKQVNCSIDGEGIDNYGFYNDSKGLCTVGIGHLVAEKSCQEIDKEAEGSANRTRKNDLSWIKTKENATKDYKEVKLKEFEGYVTKYVKVPLCQAQFDALTSLAFNIGPNKFKKSQVVTKLNNNDTAGAEAIWPKSFITENGKESKGLKNRRADELNMFKSCKPGSCTDVKASADPNHLYADPEGYMRGESNVLFTAMFENLANATAPAFDVKVVTSIDENFDIDTLSSLAVSHPNRLQNFTLDKSNREATWYFKDIELPPNKSPPEGEGWVKYSVNPVADLPSDSAMTSQARIFFDFNPPIDTNVVEHKIDRESPSTKVKSLPSETASNSFDIEWEGSDQGSGIYHQTIRVSRDGDFESYEILDTSGAVGNKMQFSGEPDKKYSFVSLAVDNVGNVETKSVPDTNTTIKQSQSQCLIATAAFGSELSPQVAFLRNFRDNHILSTAAGSSFMNVFNTWYYSFSPYVADYEREQPWLQQSIKTAIYPLLGILTLSEKAYSAMPGEYGSVAAGLVTSSLIGAVYFTPFAFASKQIRIGKSTGTRYRSVLIALAAGTVAAALMIIVFPLANPISLMISTSVLVTTALALTSIFTASLVAKVAKKLSILFSSMFSARKGTT